jgi:hypothetical protein
MTQQLTVFGFKLADALLLSGQGLAQAWLAK